MPNPERETVSERAAVPDRLSVMANRIVDQIFTVWPQISREVVPFRPSNSGHGTSAMRPIDDWICLVWYLVVHDAVHRWRLDHESFLYRTRLRQAHHYGKQEGNFGVTTAFWDRVFSTTVVGSRERRLPL